MRTCYSCGREYSTVGSGESPGIPPCTYCGWTPTGPDPGHEEDGVYVDENGHVHQIVNTNIIDDIPDSGDMFDEFYDQDGGNDLNEYGVHLSDLEDYDIEDLL